MPVGTKLRFDVFKRDRFTCQYCGRKAPDVVLYVDHVVPQSRGGTDDKWNLVTSCETCNLGKSDRSVPTPCCSGVPLNVRESAAFLLGYHVAIEDHGASLMTWERLNLLAGSAITLLSRQTESVDEDELCLTARRYLSVWSVIRDCAEHDGPLNTRTHLKWLKAQIDIDNGGGVIPNDPEAVLTG